MVGAFALTDMMCVAAVCVVIVVGVRTANDASGGSVDLYTALRAVI